MMPNDRDRRRAVEIKVATSELFRQAEVASRDRCADLVPQLAEQIDAIATLLLSVMEAKS